MSTQQPGREPRTADAPPARDSGARVLRWAAAAALLGAFLVFRSFDSSSADTAIGAPAPVSTASAAPAPSSDPVVTMRPTTGPSLPRSEPTRISIQSIGVNAPFAPMSMDATGVLQPPPDTDRNLAGWYKDGATPGERGNAVVAGHVDTKTGPAVFYLLPYLKKGDAVDITRADGSIATFSVDEVDTFSKGDFPDQRVYGDTPDAQLRIITCGGVFDRKKQDYEANVVVFAHLVSSRNS
ncbi:putative secreted protein [Actinacidiphila reveromycinica]|uniref:Putative secreted protein n=1 Tax=Actinacidiphila reveromycinica TaxID=659352 RepID=A0A7U3URZ8_9ACTN|nr:class F sortase [Streptomyces sp. SN-593]BBA97546.1 putative secreted protein [Streptomyces sp. SN-593]